jgi:hypothetical protein
VRGIEHVLRGFKSAYNEILIEVSFIIKVLMAVFHYLNKDHFTKQFLTTFYSSKKVATRLNHFVKQVSEQAAAPDK